MIFAKIKDNIIPVIVTAVLMWAGWVTLQVATSADIESVNKAQWQQIEKVKDSVLKQKIDELEDRIFRLESSIINEKKY